MFAKDLLKDKIAIVTGGGSGIGKVISLELAKAGAHVVPAARKLDRLEEVSAKIREFGVKALPVATDIGDGPPAAGLLRVDLGKAREPVRR